MRKAYPKRNPTELESYLRTAQYGLIGLIDIDDLSRYNHRHGYEQGNYVLLRLEKFLKDSIGRDFTFHLGADEYLFGCTGNFDENKESITEFASRVQKELGITISLGLTEKKGNPQQVLSRLKANLLYAKSNGKKLICFQ